MLLWQPRGRELQLLVFHRGGLCFSRQLRGFAALTGPVSQAEDELLDALALELQRSIDYLAGHLKLPEPGQLQLAIASSAMGLLVRHLEQAFGFPVSAMANKGGAGRGGVPQCLWRRPGQERMMKHHINLYGAEFRPRRLWANLPQMSLVWGGVLLLLLAATLFYGWQQQGPGP